MRCATKRNCFVFTGRPVETSAQTSIHKVMPDLFFSLMLCHSQDYYGYLGSFIYNLGTVHPALQVWCLIYFIYSMQNLHVDLTGGFGYYVYQYILFMLWQTSQMVTELDGSWDTIQRIWRLLDRPEVSDKGHFEASWRTTHFSISFTILSYIRGNKTCC